MKPAKKIEMKCGKNNFGEGSFNRKTRIHKFDIIKAEAIPNKVKENREIDIEEIIIFKIRISEN